MSFFAHFEIWCKFRFVFSKNKKLMFLDTFEAHICGTFIRRKSNKNIKIPYIQLYAIWHRKSSKNVKNHFFQNKSFFSIPMELGIQAFCQISFLDDFGAMQIFTLKRHFSDIWKIMQIPSRIRREHNLELRSVCGCHFTPRIDFWAELMLLNEFHKRNFREKIFFSELFREVFVEGSSFWPKSGLLVWL